MAGKYRTRGRIPTGQRLPAGTLQPDGRWLPQRPPFQGASLACGTPAASKRKLAFIIVRMRCSPLRAPWTCRPWEGCLIGAPRVYNRPGANQRSFLQSSAKEVRRKPSPTRTPRRREVNVCIEKLSPQTPDAPRVEVAKSRTVSSLSE